MAVVVSDTSPIVALSHLSRLELLHGLFGDILIPPAVAAELRKPTWATKVVDPSKMPFVTIRAPQDRTRVNFFARSLDPGESEAIALALEAGIKAILIDEREGREVAQKAGLKTMGVIGILLTAKRKGLLSAVGPELDRLRRELGFRISEKIRAEAMLRAGEQD